MSKYGRPYRPPGFGSPKGRFTLTIETDGSPINIDELTKSLPSNFDIRHVSAHTDQYEISSYGTDYRTYTHGPTQLVLEGYISRWWPNG